MHDMASASSLDMIDVNCKPNSSNDGAREEEAEASLVNGTSSLEFEEGSAIRSNLKTLSMFSTCWAVAYIQHSISRTWHT